MLGGKEERAAPVPPSMLARTEEIQQQLQQLSGRDLQLWSLGILVILMLTAGLLAFLIPNLMWTQRVIRVEQSYLPQLFFGLISLIVLSNIYLLGQRLTLNTTRRALIRELVLNERLESLSLIDPLTQLLNRRALNELIPREVARSNRVGSPLTVLSLDIDGFRDINARFGVSAGDEVLVEFGKMLKTVFRGGDMVFRQGGDEFLVMLPDTCEEEAHFPLQRLLREVEEWNVRCKKGFNISYSWGLAPYATGGDVADLLRAVDRKLYQKKHNLVPVF